MAKPHIAGMLLLLWLGATLPLSAADRSASISGYIYYQNGHPVHDASVTVHSFAAQGMIVPDPVKTDQTGHFQLNYPALGDGIILASKLDEGYPELDLAIYGRAAFLTLQRVNLVPGGHTDVTIHLGRPYPLATFSVIDSSTGQAIKDARIQGHLLQNEHAYFSSTIDESGLFTLALPSRSLAIKITSPGHKKWTCVMRGSGSKQTESRPVHQQRIVSLVPVQP